MVSVASTARRRAGHAAPAALAAALMLALMGAAPAWSHFAQRPDESAGHDGTPLDPLNAFTFIGPAGTKVESKPCKPALDFLGMHNAGPVEGNQHIGHIEAIEGLSPSAGNYVAADSADLWHLDFYELPEDVEGAPGGITYPLPSLPPYVVTSAPRSILLGVDGFVRVRMEQTIVDGLGAGNDGYDLRVHDFHEWSSYCVYGSLYSTGPWIFMGTAFYEGGVGTKMDMAYHYTPLYNQHVGPGPGKADYLLVVASLEKIPGIKADFGINDPPLAPAPMAPGQTTLPGTDLGFEDNYPGVSTAADPASMRYGFPKRAATPPLCSDLGQPLDEDTWGTAASVCNDGGVTPEEMRDSSPDPITRWEWWFDQDPSPAVSFAIGLTWPHHVGQWPPNKAFPTPGEYDVCLRVTTQEGEEVESLSITGYVPSSMRDVECKKVVVADPPPVPQFNILLTGCYDPWATAVDSSYEPEGEVVDWEWDWGDGGTSSGLLASHQYKTSGDYLVRLTVTDNDGQSAEGSKLVSAIGRDDCPLPPVNSLLEKPDPRIPVDRILDAFALLDSDKDGIADRQDRCPTVASLVLKDLDRDGLGDACDDDLDGDGLLNVVDACPEVPDAGASDLDGDGRGDACDPDADGDGVPNIGDRCPRKADPGQEDLDVDGTGDACDADRDNDGRYDVADAFPTDPLEWADGNANGVGDNAEHVASLTEGGRGRGASDSIEVVPLRDKPWTLVLLSSAVAVVLVGVAAFLLGRRSS